MQQPDVKAYVETSRAKSDMERMELSTEKTGVFSGLYAINPATNKNISGLDFRLRPDHLWHRCNYVRPRARHP